MKPKHQRLAFISVSMIFLCISALLTLRAFRENLVFFYSPSELAEHTAADATLSGHTIRIGGLVASGSIVRSNQEDIVFNVSDGKATVSVSYHGLLPNLFREGQGVVAEGKLKDATHFDAKTILAKHDENYMPREVVDALKKSGQWQGNEGKKP